MEKVTRLNVALPSVILPGFTINDTNYQTKHSIHKLCSYHRIIRFQQVNVTVTTNQKYPQHYVFHITQKSTLNCLIQVLGVL